MAKPENSLFTLMVIGKEPDEIVKKYDASLEVEPYVKYEYSKIKKYRQKAIKMAQEMVDNARKLSLTDFMKEYFKEKVSSLKNMSDFEYYTSLCDGCSFDEDGNAISTENPNAKWTSCRVGRNLCLPLKLKNGSEALTANAREVDWTLMHMNLVSVNTYTAAWQLFHKEREAKTDVEKQIYENVKNQKKYFEGFKSQEDYVNYCCSYWCYAYADEDSWYDADGHKDYEWITSFYDRFVKKLKPDDKITIYECSKP
jgi:hypothetical protein